MRRVPTDVWLVLVPSLADTQAAIFAVLPTSFTADFSAVSLMSLTGATVYPVIIGNYLTISTNQASSGEKVNAGMNGKMCAGTKGRRCGNKLLLPCPPSF